MTKINSFPEMIIEQMIMSDKFRSAYYQTQYTVSDAAIKLLKEEGYSIPKCPDDYMESLQWEMSVKIILKKSSYLFLKGYGEKYLDVILSICDGDDDKLRIAKEVFFLDE